MPPKSKAKSSAVSKNRFQDDSSDDEAGYRITRNKQSRWRRVDYANEVGHIEEKDDDDDSDIELKKVYADSLKKTDSLFSEKTNVFQKMITGLKERACVAETPKVIDYCTNIYSKKVDKVHEFVQKLDVQVFKGNPSLNKKKKKDNEDAPGETAAANEDEDMFVVQENSTPINSDAENEIENLGEDDDGAPSRKATQNDQTMMPFDADAAFKSKRLMDDNDWNNDGNLAAKLDSLAYDRTLLVGDVVRKPEFIFKALNRAINTAELVLKDQKLKRMAKNKKGRKCKDDDDEVSGFTTASNDKPVFINSPYYCHASRRKRESRFACFDDVAFSDESRSLVYLHNQWDENFEPKPDFRDDDFCLNEIADLDDIFEDPIAASMEHLQGAYENATNEHHVLDPMLIEMLGLDRGDLVEPSNMQEFVDVPYEQLSDANKDPDKCLVDHLSIPGEQEYVDGEQSRIFDLLVRLYKERVKLPGGASNPQEDEIRRSLNKVPFAPQYENEDDVFFALEQRPFLTEESVNTEIALLRKVVFERLTPDEAEQIGIPKPMHWALRRLDVGAELTNDLKVLGSAIPNYFLAKQLLQSFNSTYAYLAKACKLVNNVVPFRYARYAEQIISSVLYQVRSDDVPTMPRRLQTPSVTFGTSMSSFVSSATKKLKSDSALAGLQYLFFFARDTSTTPLFDDDKIRKPSLLPIAQAVANVFNSDSSMNIVNSIFEQFKPLNLFWCVVFVSSIYENNCEPNKRIESLDEIPHSSLKDVVNDDTELLEPKPEQVDIDFDNDVGRVHNLDVDDNIGHDFEPVDDANGFDNIEYPDNLEGEFQLPLSDSGVEALNNLEREMKTEPVNDIEDVEGSVSQDLFSGATTPVNYYDNILAEVNGVEPSNQVENEVESSDDDTQNKSDEQPLKKSKNEDVETLLSLINGYCLPEKVKKPRKKRKHRGDRARWLDNGDDEAHWRKCYQNKRNTKQATKKVEGEENEEDTYEEDLLFSPQYPKNVTVRERQSAKYVETYVQRRQIDTIITESCQAQHVFRLDDMIKLKCPAKFDPSSTFVTFPYDCVREFMQSNFGYYRSQFSHLPLTSEQRIANDLKYFAKVHRYARLLDDNDGSVMLGHPEFVQQDDSSQEDDSIININPVDNDVGSNLLEFGDVEEYPINDHEHFRTTDMFTENRPRSATDFVDFDGEFHAKPADVTPVDINVEIDFSLMENRVFDFDSVMGFSGAIEQSFRNPDRMCLKRAIRYILRHKNMDRNALPNYINSLEPKVNNGTEDTGDGASKAKETVPKQIGASTNGIAERVSSDTADDAVSLAETIDIVVERDDDILSSENDETVQKNFQIDGFHTFRSLLYFLPAVCVGETIEQLNVRRVLTTLFHMVNENELFLVSDKNSPVSVASDFQIVNYDESLDDNF